MYKMLGTNALNNQEETHPELEALGSENVIPDDLSYQERLDYFSHYDSLTGLYNRKSFNEHLAHLLSATHQMYAEHVLVYIDLDQFKIINDVCGDASGDEILIQLSMQLKNFVRKWDVVSRLGNDTFGIVLLYCSSKNAIRVAENIRLTIKATNYSFQDVSYRVSASMGVVPFTAKSDTVASILSKATTACSMAKDQGRDRICLYQESDDVLASRFGEISCVTSINKALEKDRFVLYTQLIQPLYSESTQGKHYEILVRMLNDQEELVSPALFLPAAERYHIITRIDRWVVKNTLHDLMEHPNNLDEIEKIAINLSGQTLNDLDFVNYVKEIVHETNIPTNKLCFEVTETGTIGNISNAVQFIRQMREMDIVFSLDDFGTGLSSFGYLKNLPVEYLKIDGTFVKNMLQDPTDAAMVRSINEIGHVLGKKTIAEFVENAATRNLLAEIGVDYAQGYGIKEPEPFKNILR